METFILKNLSASSELSVALSEFVEVVKSQGVEVKVKNLSDDTKGSLILEVAIILGEGIAVNAVYDFLKYSLRRLGDSLDGETPLEIDDEVRTVNEMREDS
ncbi:MULTISPECIES: hypothetical protein [unclassified Janthinobacterium]|uniref:hypothetical protein n=1 Tax=unclassified Janthinobacterium TaxID=2610881 RepID=UPI001179A95E|nr:MULTISPECIES: hypothetical protein [unclassified Janthinobacterium]MDO8069086.1 hypothetical protein [Janthinobacterium sp. SUN206]